LKQGPTLLRQQYGRLQSKVHSLEQRIAKNAPSSNNPAKGLQALLKSLFDNIYEAFIYFDEVWIVSLYDVSSQQTLTFVL
jgi:hypothetical protein